MKPAFQKIKTLLNLIHHGQAGLLAERWRFWKQSKRLAAAQGPFVYVYDQDRMVCDPGVHDSRSIFLEKPTDPFERKLFRLWLHPGDWAVDAGANAGLFTAVAGEAVGPKGQVTALEPTPRLARLLKENSSLLGHSQTDVREVALGGAPGRAKFAFAGEGETAVSQSLATNNVPEGAAEIREVEIVSLAGLAAEHPGKVPALVKLDVEGAEKAALEGCPADWKGKDGPLWVVECHPEALGRFQSSPKDLYRHFSDKDYELLVVGKFAGENSGDLAPEKLNRDQAPRASFWNLVALPRGQRWQRRREKLGRHGIGGRDR